MIGKWKRFVEGRSGSLLAGLGALLASGWVQAKIQYNMDPGTSPIAKQIYDLHTTIMWVIVVIFVAVFGVMFYSIYAHRKSIHPVPAKFHENTTVEVVWTVIPFIILILMALPATKTLLEMKDTSSPEMTIKVTGSQWKWTYDYLDSGFGYTSSLSTPLAQINNQEPKGEHYLLEVDRPMVVPVGRKVRVLITAADVLHAWWVPSLGVKQDAIPGFVRDAWFRSEKVGVYRGQCAELCGKDHGFMPIVVEVKSQEEYAKWVADQKKSVTAAADDPARTWEVADLVARGEKVYQANCMACHQATGKGAPPAFPPLDGSKVVAGPKQDQIALVLNGKANTAMAPWKQLSDTELAAVITYTRNAWGNKSAEAIQPGDVKIVRGGGTVAGGGAPAAAGAGPAGGGAAAAGSAPPAVVAAPAAGVAPPAAVATAPAAAAAPPAASAAAVLPAKVYFEVGKANLGKDADDSIKAVVGFLKGNAGAKIDITGYTDKTGNRAANLELAKERAKSVRAALEAAGVAKDRINMKPPAEITGGGNDREARRVEINVAG